jgi:hypothetical protein
VSVKGSEAAVGEWSKGLQESGWMPGNLEGEEDSWTLEAERL